MQAFKRLGLTPRVLSSFCNAVVNVFWSLIAFVPVSVFCYRFMDRVWLSVFVGTSLIAFMMPASKLKYLELSFTIRTYRKLGVHWANHFVQQGSLINQLLRRSYPGYQRLPSRTRMLQSTYVQERFHWTVFLFFLLSSIYAITHGYQGWTLLITILNVIYNLYPIWLQQYIRKRLSRFRSN